MNVFRTTIADIKQLVQNSLNVSQFLVLLLVVEICPDLLSPAHVDVLLHLVLSGELQCTIGYNDVVAFMLGLKCL